MGTLNDTERNTYLSRISALEKEIRILRRQMKKIRKYGKAQH